LGAGGVKRKRRGNKKFRSTDTNAPRMRITFGGGKFVLFSNITGGHGVERGGALNRQNARVLTMVKREGAPYPSSEGETLGKGR